MHIKPAISFSRYIKLKPKSKSKLRQLHINSIKASSLQSSTFSNSGDRFLSKVKLFERAEWAKKQLDKIKSLTFVLFNFFESIFEVHDKLMVLRIFMYALF